MEVTALNFERCEFFVTRLDAGTHLCERVDDAAHRPAAERGVAGERGLKRLGGEDSGEEAHGSAGVPGVEGAARGVEPAETHAVNFDGPVAGFDFYSEAAEAIQSAGAILGCGIIAEFARALGERGENGVAMRDRFIARNFDCAVDFAGRADCFFRHPGILACVAARFGEPTQPRVAVLLKQPRA